MSLTQTNPTNVTPPYARANNQGQKSPIYYCTFGVVTGPLGTASLSVPFGFCTNPVPGATQTLYRCMSNPTSAPNTIQLITYQSSLSQITFSLLDISIGSNNQIVTQMVTNYPMKNRLVSIFKGYAGMNQADYAQIYVGQVNNWQLSQDGTSYIFTVTDPQKQLTTSILKGHSQLVKDFNPGDPVIYLTTSFYFAQATDLQDGNGPRNYVQIDDCLFSYTGNASGIIAEPTGITPALTWNYIGQGVASTSTPQWVSGKGYYSDGTVGSQVFWAFVGPVTSSLTAPAWVTSHSYSVGTRASANGNVYQVIIAGTSASSGTGPNSVGYNLGNKVFNLGNIYQCVVAGSSSNPTIQDGTMAWNWVSAGVVTGTYPQWLQNHIYTQGSYVYNLGNIYIATNTATSSATGNGPSGTTTGPTGFGSTASALFGIQQVVLNGNGASVSQTHQAGAKVDNYILFQGNPITIMLQIIMSTGTGSNYSGTGVNYDVLPASQGIGVPWYLVNTAHFIAQQNTFLSWFYFSQYFKDMVTAIQFFQKHFFQQCQLFTFTNKSGQLDMNCVYAALPTNNFTQIDDTNIIGIPQFDASLQTGNNFVNEVDVLWDYQPVADFYVNETITINNAAQQATEENAIGEVDCMFVSSQYKGSQIAKRITNIMSNLYSLPLPVVTVTCISQLQTVNPGDTILLASSWFPNLLTGKRGGTVICMCIASAPDFTADTCVLTLFATGFASNNRYAVIGPAGMPTYTLATAAQRNYAFASQLVSTNFSVGQMGNGDPGYLVCP